MDTMFNNLRIIDVIEILTTNIDIIMGVVFIIIVLVVTYKPEKKEKKTIPIVGLDPNTITIFEKILGPKTTYYISQMNVIMGNYDENEIIETSDIFVNDVKLTLGENMLQQLYTIYNKDTFDIVLKQHFLNNIYMIDEKTYTRPLGKEIFDG